MLLLHSHFCIIDQHHQLQGPAGALRDGDGRAVAGRVPAAAARADHGGTAEAVGAEGLLGREGSTLPRRRTGRTVSGRTGMCT